MHSTNSIYRRCWTGSVQLEFLSQHSLNIFLSNQKKGIQLLVFLVLYIVVITMLIMISGIPMSDSWKWNLSICVHTVCVKLSLFTGPNHVVARNPKDYGENLYMSQISLWRSIYRLNRTPHMSELQNSAANIDFPLRSTFFLLPDTTWVLST